MENPNFSAMCSAVSEAIEQMVAEHGDKFLLKKVNLAELERHTGISRAKLRRMKEHNFESTEHAIKGRKSSRTLLSGEHHVEFFLHVKQETYFFQYIGVPQYVPTDEECIQPGRPGGAANLAEQLCAVHTDCEFQTKSYKPRHPLSRKTRSL